MSAQNDPRLFRDFPPPSPEDWLAKLKADLKGKDPARLDWKTGEGFVMQPMYFRSDLQKPFSVLPEDRPPGSFPYLRGLERSHTEIRQAIYTDSIARANALARELIERGSTGLEFLCKAISKPPKSATENTDAPHFLILGLPLQKRQDVEDLLSGLSGKCLSLHFRSGLLAPVLLPLLLDTKISAKRLTLDFDPLSLFLETGHLPASFEDEMARASEMLFSAKEAARRVVSIQNIHVLAAQGRIFREAGAGAVLELACVLAAGSEYLDQMLRRGHAIEEIAGHIHLELSIGPSYFLEMARLRVLRLLWSRILVAYGLLEEEAAKVYVTGRALYANKTRLDAHTNLLRTTTEAMSAILGGADSFVGRSMYAMSDMAGFDEFGERISRNTQVMLFEESYLGRVQDPVAGSYYIENLVNEIAQSAWKEFQGLEAEGGLLSSLRKGSLQKRIEKAGREFLADVAQRKRLILGSNQYPNPLDNLSEKYDKEAPAMLSWKLYEGKGLLSLASKDEKTCAQKSESIRSILPFQWGQEFEELRRQAEALPKKPKVFLYVYGNIVMRRARASFAANFFGCAGLSSIDHPGFGSLEEGVLAAKQSSAGIVVLCASDEDYASDGSAILSALKDALPDAILVLAGKPECLSELEKAGIAHAIHAHSNVLEVLKGILGFA